MLAEFYVSGMICAKCVAPARAHSLASSLISLTARQTEGRSPSKVQPLRCFQSHQAVRMAMEASPRPRQRGESAMERQRGESTARAERPVVLDDDRRICG